MAIPIESIKEGCCDSRLSSLSIIDGDSLDPKGSTVDKIIECKDKYYLVEEKSILLDFSNKLCQKNKRHFVDFKVIKDESEYFNISEISKLIETMSKDSVKLVLQDSIIDMIGSSGKKASNTTNILNKKFDSTKTSNMPMIYLYCKSGKPIDKILERVLQKRKINFIECNSLKKRLEEQC